MEFQSQDAKLVEAIKILNENKSTAIVQTMLIMFDELINKARRENDEAMGELLLINQGMIKGIKRMREYIIKGTPKQEIANG